jgi:hypothetical protein
LQLNQDHDHEQLLEDEVKLNYVHKDYLHQITTRLSTLLIQTERGVYKREDSSEQMSFQNESFEEESGFP